MCTRGQGNKSRSRRPIPVGSGRSFRAALQRVPVTPQSCTSLTLLCCFHLSKHGRTPRRSKVYNRDASGGNQCVCFSSEEKKVKLKAK